MDLYLVFDDSIVVPIISFEGENKLSYVRWSQLNQNHNNCEFILNISIHAKQYSILRDLYGISSGFTEKKTFTLVLQDNTYRTFYGSIITELTWTDNKDILELEIHSDYFTYGNSPYFKRLINFRKLGI